MAHHFRNLKNVFCYSGGTETTAMFPKVAEIAHKSGFRNFEIIRNRNPVYTVKFDENEHSIVCFSKK